MVKHIKKDRYCKLGHEKLQTGQVEHMELENAMILIEAYSKHIQHSFLVILLYLFVILICQYI